MTPRLTNPSNGHLPLSPAVYHILLALSEGELHGLGIANEVEWMTAGQILLGPGTLYRSLRNMADDGLIQETETDEADDPRRKFYRITAAGHRVLKAESERLARLVHVARERRVIPEGRS